MYLTVFLSTNIIFLFTYFYLVTLNNLIYTFKVRIRVDPDSSSELWSSFNENYFFVRYNLVDISKTACQVTYFLRSACRLINEFTSVCYSCQRVMVVCKPISPIHKIRLFKTISRAFYASLFIGAIVSAVFISKSFDLAKMSQNLTFFTNETQYTESKFHPYWLMPTYSNSKCRMWAYYGRQTNKILYRVYYFTIIGCHFIVCASIFIILLKMRASRNFNIAHRDRNQQLSLTLRMQNALGRVIGSSTTISNYFIEPASTIMIPRNQRWFRWHSRKQSSKWPLTISLILSIINLPVCILSFNYLIRTISQETSFNRTYQSNSVAKRGWSILFIFNLQILNHSVTTLMMIIFSKLYRLHLRSFMKYIRRPTRFQSIGNLNYLF